MIALLSDFGLCDGAVAVMKGVIKSINPSVELIDISHDISAYSIREAAFVLDRCYSYFPKKTIFLSVVDPGVGSQRKAILLSTNDYFFIAPDNGLLTYISLNKKDSKIYHLTNPKYRLAEISSTFHGRDIFAPAAAYLSLGIDFPLFGEQLNEIVTFKVHSAKKISFSSVEGEILFFDQYGNAYTNIKKSLFQSDFNKEKFELFVNNKKLSFHLRMASCFSDVDPGKMLIYFGSSDLLELAICQGNLNDQLDLKCGDLVKFCPLD